MADNLKNEVEVDVFEKARKADGTLDETKVASIMAEKQRALDKASSESKARKEKIKENVTALSQKEQEIKEREDKIKKTEELKLKEDERYQELVLRKEEELKTLREKEKLQGNENAELKEYKSKMDEQQATLIDKRLATLSEKNREVFEIAASGMADNEYGAKLALLDKLKEPISASKNKPVASGGRQTTATGSVADMDLAELKKTNPQLYTATMKEQLDKN